MAKSRWLRVTRRHQRKTKYRTCVRILVRCGGCCDGRLEIHPEYDPLPLGINTDVVNIEINGVSGTVEEWRKILLPLLGAQKIPLSDIPGSGVENWVLDVT